MWKTKLLNFHLLSKSQKKNTNSNKIYINYKENEYFRYVQNIPNIKHCFKNSISFNEKLFKNEKNNNNDKHNNFLNRKVDNNIINNNKKEYSLFNDKLLHKKEYLNYILDINKEGVNILSSLFKKFYVIKRKKNTCTYLRSISNKKNMLLHLYIHPLSNLNSDSISYQYSNKKIDKYINNKKNRKYYYFYNSNSDSSNKKFINSKYLWDNLDYSIINVLSSVFFSNKQENNQYKFSFFNDLLNKINNIIINSDILYIDVIKKEFYNVNRDINIK